MDDFCGEKSGVLPRWAPSPKAAASGSWPCSTLPHAQRPSRPKEGDVSKPVDLCRSDLFIFFTQSCACHTQIQNVIIWNLRQPSPFRLWTERKHWRLQYCSCVVVAYPVHSAPFPLWYLCESIMHRWYVQWCVVCISLHIRLVMLAQFGWLIGSTSRTVRCHCDGHGAAESTPAAPQIHHSVGHFGGIVDCDGWRIHQVFGKGGCFRVLVSIYSSESIVDIVHPCGSYMYDLSFCFLKFSLVNLRGRPEIQTRTPPKPQTTSLRYIPGIVWVCLNLPLHNL